MRDSLVAIKLVPEIGTTIASPATWTPARMIEELVSRVARNDRDLDGKGALEAALIGVAGPARRRRAAAASVHRPYGAADRRRVGCRTRLDGDASH